MSTSLPVPPEFQKYVDHATYADLHPGVMLAVEAGTFTILDLFDNLEWFRSGADWKAWRAFLCAVYALPMDDQELAIYRECTGRREPPTEEAREVWCPTGRRARKSATAALIAVFEGAYRDYSKYLAPGERANIPIIAKNKAEAQQIATFVKAVLSDHSLRHLLLEEPGAERIRLTGRVDLNIVAVSLTAGRSRTNVLALLDEVAFFAVEGAVPDVDVIRGIKPGMATVPGAKLFGLSSPFGKRGVLFDAFKTYYPQTELPDGRTVYDAEKEAAANRDRVLVWKAPTLTMHRTPQLEAEVAAAFAADPVGASAEYGADFREDTAAFVLERLLDAAIVKGRYLMLPGAQNYFGFVDPSGGSADSMTLAVAHFEHDQPEEAARTALLAGEVTYEQLAAVQMAPKRLDVPGKVVLDFVREWRAPFDPKDVTAECALDLKRYGLRLATGDKYGGRWPWSGFKEHAINYQPSRRPKNDIYRECLPILNSGSAELLDHPLMKAQFLALDRNVARGGRETIDHAPGGHDDVANAVAGALVLAREVGSRMKPAQVTAAPAESVQEIHRRRIAEALHKANVTPAAKGNSWRRR